jgi:hypothetical protein
MKTRMAVALTSLTLVTLGSAVGLACGDKFLMVGRGVSFQRAYAAVHPASIVIVLPPKSVKSAAVRDQRLLTALKMAGHKVEVIKQAADLRDALTRSRRDIVLAERADAAAFPDLTTEGQVKPAIVGVVEDPTPTEFAAARQQLDYVLKVPSSASQVLNMLDDVMKTRIDAARRSQGL